MILYFPDLDTLRLAITSGTVPPAVTMKPAVAGFDDQNHVWLQTSDSLSRGAQAALQKLGAQIKKASGATLSVDVCCWLQVLPLEKAVSPGGTGDQAQQAPVLFELPDAGSFSVMVAEILRLGNDRQSFRWLNDGAHAHGLLRVIAPPYYSLLRALDRSGDNGAPRAYLERSPGVWVEVGYTHPLVQQIKPPRGQSLMLRPPRDWVLVQDGPFSDIYDVLEFELPGSATAWQPALAVHRHRVPLRLTRGGHRDQAELWVLRDQALDTLDAFVRSAEDPLLARLAFAVCETHGDKCIVLRVRSSRLPPPVLVLEAEAFRPYLKLDNLFLPVGTQLHPPLRRDAVRKLLADDPDQVTWLYPGPDGTFIPESVPDTAFRPLSDWVDYVLDHDRVPLQTWVQAAQFDFEPFICKDDKGPGAPKPPAREPRDRHKDKGKEEEPTGPDVPFKVVPKTRKKQDLEAIALGDLPRIKPSELQKRLHAVEKQFLDLPGALDTAERQELWPDMARLNKALGNAGDATVCWVNALWEEHDRTAYWAREWSHGECLGSGQLDGEVLDRLLDRPNPGMVELRGLASCLVWSAYRQEAPPALIERLGRVQHFLELHELLLPVRGTWLAWVSLVKLSRGDVLALARARDRLLERLFSNGLSSDQDLPTFLRFSGLRSSDKFRTYRDWLIGLPEKVHFWIELTRSRTEYPTARTQGYADLILAYGLARLGESNEARKLQQQGKETLFETTRGALDKDHMDVHTALLDAYTHRITQALEGKPNSGILPPELLDYLEHMERMARYKVDRLRKHSRILEPHEKVDPYRLWAARFLDDLSRTLAFLGDLSDRQEMSNQLRQLLASTSRDKAARSRYAAVLQKALELAPRIGEAFALEILAGVPQALDVIDRMARAEDTTDDVRKALLVNKASLLERAIFVAAHFNHVEFVQQLVVHFEALFLQSGAHALESVTAAGQCFRSLRKLGMREHINRLLRQMADVILQGNDLTSACGEPNGSWVLCTLLHVASGWYYFGQEAQARPIVDHTRQVLFKGELTNLHQKPLACTYIATLGQAPAELALRGIEELLDKLERVNDTFTTNTHYSLSQLEVVEAIVQAVATEDFAVGTAARHWLEDDEFLVRRRIHRDVNELVSQAQI